MKILTIGDVVGEAGLDALHALLRRIKRDTGADFVIVNGENAAGNGVTNCEFFAGDMNCYRITASWGTGGFPACAPRTTSTATSCARPTSRRRARGRAGAFLTARRAAACSSST